MPCVWGTDCKDCGRSASLAATAAAAAAAARRRLVQALPAVNDAHEMHHLNLTLRAATSYHLPAPWLKALQIKDHWNL